MENSTLTAGLALSFGLLHALEPGHGKTALLTYLASGKKTWKDGVIISLTSAFTHSLAVFLIAFLSHYIFHHNSKELQAQIIGNYLSIGSGALIVALGLWVIYADIKAKSQGKAHAHTCCGGHHNHEHEHGHHNSHDHSHDHSHHDEAEQSRATKFLKSGLLGVATGMIPCPTVVVAYLSGVSTGNSLLGIQSVLLFALGMFISLLSVIIFITTGGEKIYSNYKNKMKLPKFNWAYIQGSVFIGIGAFTALYH